MRPSSWPRPGPITCRAIGSSSRCWPAPACRPASGADLAADAVTKIGDAHWLRVPVGKLRNDRFIPLHPDLDALLAERTATNATH